MTLLGAESVPARLGGSKWLMALLMYGADRELLNYKDVQTTMNYTHLLTRGGKGVKSLIDDL